MKDRIPRPTRKNIALARLGCALAALIPVLILSSSQSFISRFKDSLGMETGILSFLFWAVVFIVLSELFIRVLLSFWLRIETRTEYSAVIRSSDLRINRTRGLGGIPIYRTELQETVDSSSMGVVDLINDILSSAFSLEASDIHISPGPDSALVGFRINGNLYPMADIPGEMYPHFVRRIKILSGLSTFKQGVPQDGHLNMEDRSFAVRVSVFPTVAGERIALRLASASANIMQLEHIGMPVDMLGDYKALLNRNQGMIIITGPTGSGKTTTLLSSLLCIREQRKNSVNIVTLEDPIESRLHGVQQTQVEQGTTLTFSAGLRSVLRQDPDVIMLGEIRDEDTASIAVRAAMTGHLILTTVHANSTSGVFSRLTQMGVDPVQLSATVRTVISQRLCRTLCQACRKEVPLDEDQLHQLKLLGLQEPPRGPFYQSEGCDECLGHGYTGRIAIFEMLLPTDGIRDMISSGVPAHTLAREAAALGMVTLLDHGLELARQGKISLMEMARVVSD